MCTPKKNINKDACVWVCGTSTETDGEPVARRGFIISRPYATYYLTHQVILNLNTIIKKCNMINNNKRY